MIATSLNMKTNFSGQMIKQSVNYLQIWVPKYRDLKVPRRSIICVTLRLQHIIDPLVTEKSQYSVQPRLQIFLLISCRLLPGCWIFYEM